MYDGYGFSSMGSWSYSILDNGNGIEEQNYVALLQGSEMSAGMHSRNLISSI